MTKESPAAVLVDEKGNVVKLDTKNDGVRITVTDNPSRMVQIETLEVLKEIRDLLKLIAS